MSAIEGKIDHVHSEHAEMSDRHVFDATTERKVVWKLDALIIPLTAALYLAAL